MSIGRRTTPAGATQNAPRFGSTPLWVTPYSGDTSAAGTGHGGTGGTEELLVESQDNVGTRESFHHRVIRILNTEGVQSASDISIAYDPTYQTLVFCSVVIRRDGRAIAGRNAIQTYGRATNPEMHTYDRSIDATIHLSDVRAGDVLEYSHVVSGYMPAFGGRFFDSYLMNYSSYVARRILRIRTPSTHPLTIRSRNNPPEPRVTTLTRRSHSRSFRRGGKSP